MTNLLALIGLMALAYIAWLIAKKVLHADTEPVEDDRSPLHQCGDEILTNYFKQQNGVNYFAAHLEDTETGQMYEIIMQKIGGETPLEQLEDSKQRVFKLEDTLKEILESPKSIHEDHELWRKAIKALSNNGEQDKFVG